MTDPRLDPEPGALVRAVARVASWLLPVQPARPLRRVLVVRTDDRVGNALLTIPLARAVKALLPDAQVDLLLPSNRLAVARGLPGVGLVAFTKQDSFKRPWRFARFLAALRGYDAVLDAAHWHAFSLTSALLSRWASRGRVVGPARGPQCLYTDVVPLPAPGVREVSAKLQLVRGLGLEPPASAALWTALGADTRELRAFTGDAPFAVINPGARKADHRWPAAQFGELAARLSLRSLVTWGPGEEALARETVASSQGRATLAPPTNLDQLAQLFRLCSLAITNDTGPMHLAVACGAPTIALLLAADGERWSHEGPRFAGVRSLDEALSAARALTAPGARASLPHPGGTS